LGDTGNDILVGVGTTDLGLGTIDILTGGGGGDRFILGEVGKMLETSISPIHFSAMFSSVIVSK
jgi:Ca2+-binding RTX toxin-like protein